MTKTFTSEVNNKIILNFLLDLFIRRKRPKILHVFAKVVLNRASGHEEVNACMGNLSSNSVYVTETHYLKLVFTDWKKANIILFLI